MHWITEQVEREKQIANEQVKIYEDLSKQIKQDVDLAITKGFIVKMNGNSTLHESAIELQGNGEDSPRSFHLKLDKKRHTITAEGSVNLRFTLGICKQGGVCLNDSAGNEVQSPEAAKAILYPFLFPYLMPENETEVRNKIWAAVGT